MTDIQFMRRAATNAGNTRCWIGIGCVIAKESKVLVEAWNETMPGEPYCQSFRDRKKSAAKGQPLPNAGCIRHDLGLSQGQEIEKVCSIHAEAAAIAKAAKIAISLDGASMFVTSFPCLICIRTIIVAGIKKVVYMNDFYKPHDMELFEKNGIKIEQITEDIVWS